MKNDLLPSLIVRYVDDYLVLWNHEESELFNVFKKVSSKYPFLQFTFEGDCNRSINYLDVVLTIKDNILFHSVHHKDIEHPLIPFNSRVPMSIKASVFVSLYLRAVSHSSTDLDFKNEMLWIEKLGESYGFRKSLIYKFLFNFDVRKKRRNSGKDIEKQNMVGSVQFSNNCFKFKSIFRKFGFDIGFKTRRNLLSSILRDRDERSIDQKAGVYKIPVIVDGRITCYIGSTARNIGVRVKEHIKKVHSWKNSNLTTSSSIIDFCKDNENAVVDWNNTSILIPFNTRSKLRIQESIAILKNETINSDIPFELSDVWIKLLKFDFGITKVNARGQ